MRRRQKVSIHVYHHTQEEREGAHLAGDDDVDIAAVLNRDLGAVAIDSNLPILAVGDHQKRAWTHV